ncbi:MAG TPA: vWA domain-containing protein [Membranihabitans sp.]|nr:vWA domain-containing protein [Membranihabitans sp.]
MNLIDISYPWWSVVVIFVIAAVIAGILYFRNTFEERKPLTVVLYLLRTLGILLILFLLLNPFLSRSENEEQPARLIFLQDQSQSISTVQDSQELQTYREQLADFFENQAKTSPVDLYGFDDEVRAMDQDAPYQGKITDISSALRFVDELHHADHVGALILATDGIYNRGTNPAYFKTRGNYPVFVLALGDTTKAQDVRIRHVLYNEIVRKNETSEIQIDISGKVNQTSPINLILQEWDINTWKNIASQRLQPQEFETIKFLKKFEQPGVVRLRALIAGVENDVNPANNSREFFVEVLETSRQIHIVSTFPHPDIGALRQVLESNEKNEVEVTIMERPQDLPDLQDFSVLVMYQIPNQPYLLEFLQNAKRQEKGIILTAGLKTNFNTFNQAQGLVSITPRTITGNFFDTRVNPGFDLFEMDDEFENYVRHYPPLAGVFGDYSAIGQGQALLLQQIGDVDTEFPVLFTGVDEGTRMAILTAEGIWKWKLFEYLEKQETPILDRMVDQVVEYVSQRKDDRLFRLQKNKLLFDETEEITFQAELYNETLERISTPDVFFELRDSSGNETQFTFDKTGTNYALNIGRLAPGNYRYRAHTTIAGQSYDESGQFSVRNIDMESFNLEANHQILSSLVHQNNGKLFYNLTELEETLSGLPSMRPLLIQSHVKTAMIDWKWIFALILLFLTSEWFLRRYFGSY